MTSKTINALNTAACVLITLALWCWIWFQAGRTF